MALEVPIRKHNQICHQNGTLGENGGLGGMSIWYLEYCHCHCNGVGSCNSCFEIVLYCCVTGERSSGAFSRV